MYPITTRSILALNAVLRCTMEVILGAFFMHCTTAVASIMERGSSAVEYRIRNHGSPGSNHPLLPFRRVGICVLTIDASVDSAV